MRIVFTPLYECRLFCCPACQLALLIGLSRRRLLADRGDDRQAIPHFDETRKVPGCENSIERGAVFLWSDACAGYSMDARNDVALAYFRSEIDQRFKQPFGSGKTEAFLRRHIEPRCR